MATIPKRGTKYQAQVRRLGAGCISRSFHTLKDAETWARHMEVRADRQELSTDTKALQHVTLGDLVTRYRDTVSTAKRLAVVALPALHSELGLAVVFVWNDQVSVQDLVAF